MSALWLGLLLFGGCRKATGPEAMVSSSPPRSGAAGALRERVIGPASWSGVGLCMSVPREWAGTSGPAPQLLQLQHGPSGATVRLQAWPWGTTMPQRRPDFALVFEGPGQYRTVPLLTPASTYTLSTTSGELVHGWVGTSDGRLLVVEVQAPFGRMTEGRAAMDALVGSLRRCDAAAGPPRATGP